MKLNIYPGEAWRERRQAEAKRRRTNADKWIGRVIAWSTLTAAAVILALVAR